MFVAKTADERQAMLVRFLRALRKAARDYHDAFTGPGEQRPDGPGAPETLAIIGRYLGEEPARLTSALPYVDPEARIDGEDVAHQIDWSRAQEMVQGELDTAALVDRRYAVPLP